MSLQVEEFWNSVKIWQSCRREIGVFFSGDGLMIVNETLFHLQKFSRLFVESGVS